MRTEAVVVALALLWQEYLAEHPNVGQAQLFHR
jgi:hypothetical protein